MKKMNAYRPLLLMAALFAPGALFSQEQKPPEPPPAEHQTAEATSPELPEPDKVFVEFGVRHFFGDVYGRPDLPFKPSLQTSKYNEYRDIRNGFFIRRFRTHLDNVFGTNKYLSLQSDKAIYKDQSYLATFGQYGKFKTQFRYDEIPHVFSNTTRTIYTEISPGVYTIPGLLRSNLQAIAASGAGCAAGVVGCQLPFAIQTQLVPQMTFVTPQLLRRAVSGLVSYNFNPYWNLSASYWREHQSGRRPIGTILNSSPSAALNGGFGEELLEPIDYFNNLIGVGAEYSTKNWGFQTGYVGSLFENNIGEMRWDNPFRTTDCVAPTGCNASTQGPATGRNDLYPHNQAHYINFAAALNVTRWVHLLASISPGWLRQNDAFLPYTTNTLRAPSATPLPESSLHGQKQTLAMNYTLVSPITKNLELKAIYRHYDYNNNTRRLEFTPIQGDISAADPANPDENRVVGFNRKNLELTGNWFFGKKSSFKAGYEGEWMDRSHRDVAHSMENAFVTALDLNPHKDLNFRVSYRHGVRTPDAYDDEAFSIVSGGITEEQVNHRRFDEAARVRDRADAQVQYDLSDRLSFSAFGGTLQDDYNHRGGTNSATPLNFIAGTTHPYYLYGVLKDISYNYGFDADYVLPRFGSAFAEYSHERYHKRLTSRNRTPGGAVALPMSCAIAGRACDSPNNDWESTTRDLVDIYTVGWDLIFAKRSYFTTYYSLSAAKGNVFARPLGDPTLLTGPNKFVLTGTNAAVDYPETTSRTHEVTAIFRYKLTKNFMPKFEYRYQQFDSRDYQTTPMTPYMGCISGLAPSAPIPGCGNLVIGTPSNIYPYFVVGDPSAARYLFLGTDQPSFRTHYMAATLEYHF